LRVEPDLRLGAAQLGRLQPAGYTWGVATPAGGSALGLLLPGLEATARGELERDPDLRGLCAWWLYMSLEVACANRSSVPARDAARRLTVLLPRDLRLGETLQRCAAVVGPRGL
jgi:hypothetical protein